MTLLTQKYRHYRLAAVKKNTADKTIAIEIDSNKPVKHHAMRTIHGNVLCIACQEI